MSQWEAEEWARPLCVRKLEQGFLPEIRSHRLLQALWMARGFPPWWTWSYCRWDLKVGNNHSEFPEPMSQTQGGGQLEKIDKLAYKWRTHWVQHNASPWPVPCKSLEYETLTPVTNGFTIKTVNHRRTWDTGQATAMGKIMLCFIAIDIWV